MPDTAAPVANYIPFNIANGMLYISGQLPMIDGKLAFTGKVGDVVSVEDGQKAAKACALNILAQLNAAIEGDFLRIKKCVKLGNFYKLYS